MAITDNTINVVLLIGRGRRPFAGRAEAEAYLKDFR